MALVLNNLPEQLTSFIGREQEIDEIKARLGQVRLLTLTGMGGSGKSRLSIKIAANSTGDFPDGVWFVQLDAISDPELVAQTVASTLGIREDNTPDHPIIDTLAGRLKTAKMLVVFDNCEHVAEACAVLVDNLLKRDPGVKILATSRQPLGVSGEVVWPVPPLSLPDTGSNVSVSNLARYEAVQLFNERAGQSRPGFIMSPENAGSVVELCRQLDGLPLSIELAAARVKVLSVEQILVRLGERFRLLTSTGSLTGSTQPRQQTLTALIDWSYDLLTQSEQAMLRSLSVFARSFDLEAVQAVSGDAIDEYEVIDLLSRLTDKSLIVMEEHNGKARYRLLETIKQYAAHKLKEAGEGDEVRKRHRDHYLHLAEDAQTQLQGKDQVDWFDRLELDHDNLRGALEWSIEGEHNPDAALLMTSMLWRFWDVRGYITEGRRWLEEALSITGDASPLVRAKALTAAANLAIEQGDHDRATDLHTEALELRRLAGDKRGIAASLSNLGVTARTQGDYARATELYKESLSIFQEMGNEGTAAAVLGNLGFVAQLMGDFRRAEELHSHSLAFSRKVGDDMGVAISLNNMGEAAQGLSEYERAEALYREALAISQELGDKLNIVGVINNLGSLAYSRGNREEALQLYAQGLEISRNMDYLAGVVEGLEGMSVALRGKYDERAARLFGAASVLRDKLGEHPAPLERVEYEKQIDQVRARMGTRFNIAAEFGRSLNMDEAIALAMSPLPAEQAAEANGDAGAAYANEPEVELTRRELEVLRLVAEGMTDAQVASKLSISTRTVNAHLHSVYEKLGVTTRNAATRWAVSSGLV